MLPPESKIRKFYDGQKIFITGGTGFMGKLLVEKLLRSTDVAKIFLLIREKKGKDVDTRLDELFGEVVFEKLKKERPDFRDRVVAMAGDCSVALLGLTIADREVLKSEVNVAFHVAATVSFDENLKTAYSTNVEGTADVLELCRGMTSLKALVHVSTVFSNCHLSTIDEQFYDYAPDYEEVAAMLENLSKSEVDVMTKRIIGNWPNTYAFTKALAESLIKNTAGSIPMGIFRPSIVISTYKEPIEYWIDNTNGATGATVGGAYGLLRVLNCDGDLIADLIPADTCIAGIIASAWDITDRKTETATPNIPIYNYVSSVENSITWDEFNDLNKHCVMKYPSQNALWTMDMLLIKNNTLNLFLKIILHLIPALILDLLLIVSGQKPRMVSMSGKINKFCDVTAFFAVREWKFKNDNVVALWEKMNTTDRKLFPLSITTVPWLTYFRNSFKGIRVYLLKDPPSTFEAARARNRKFLMASFGIKFLLVFLVMRLLWVVTVNFVAVFTDAGRK